jgi:hypothetical protein
MRTETFFQSHPVKLTGEEVADRARENAELLGQSEAKSKEIEAYAEEAKATKKRLEGEKEALDASCYRLGRVVRTGQEERQVACEERDVMSTLVIETVRLDTGAVVGSRAMTKEEILDRQQIKIPLPGMGTKGGRRVKVDSAPNSTEIAEVKAIANLLRVAGEQTKGDAALALGELADLAADMTDKRSVLAALALASKAKNRTADEREALLAAFVAIGAGKHLAKAN